MSATGVLLAAAHGHAELLTLPQASDRAGLGPDATPMALARALRARGAHAVLVIDARWPAWLDAPHADGFITASKPLRDLGALAQQWNAQMQAGFVAADAALLGAWDGQGWIPFLTVDIGKLTVQLRREQIAVVR